MNKKKHPIEDSNFLNEVVERPSFFEWAMEHKQTISYTAVGILALAVGFIWWEIKSNTHLEQTYANASEAYNLLPNLEASNKLAALLNQHASLQARYQGDLAQAYIMDQSPEKALPWIQSSEQALLRLNLAYYADYVRGTQFIEGQNYAEALAASKKLQEDLKKIDSQEFFEDQLYLSNLLRIGLLQRHLGNKVAAREVWAEFETLLSGNGIVSPSALALFMKNIDNQGISLRDL